MIMDLELALRGAGFRRLEPGRGAPNPHTTWPPSRSLTRGTATLAARSPGRTPSRVGSLLKRDGPRDDSSRPRPARSGAADQC